MEEHHSQPVPVSLIIFNVALVVLIGALGVLVYITPKGSTPSQNITQVPPKNKHLFDALTLKAQSVVVYDAYTHEVIYEKDKDTSRPLASITKVMMALTARDILPANEKISINKDFLREEGDSGLFVNETWRLKDLVNFALVVSSNDGAKAIASVAGSFGMQVPEYSIGREKFIEKMNEKARSLNLPTLSFYNETGLDVAGAKSGGYGSAYDVAKLFAYVLQTSPDIFEGTTKPKEVVSSLEKQHSAENTNEIISKIPNPLASKTGYTALAGGNLAVAFDAGVGHPIVIVVLGSTESDRFTDMLQLVNTTMAYIRS
jgi:D-alanyl-D-alanine carboxypeptidase